MSSVIVLGIGSDIGRELAVRFSADGWSVSGTVRPKSSIDQLPEGARLVQCDLTSVDSVNAALERLSQGDLKWDLLVVAAGTEEPIGPFWDCEPDAWDENIRINALAPLRLVRGLYPKRNTLGKPSVAFFSGSGTNSAAPAYSAYCSSKILLIKMCELLDAESLDTNFFIVGPGIVHTKIHQQTLRAGDRSGSNYQKVVDFLDSPGAGTSHDDVYACLRWCMDVGKAVIGGRNVSLVYDSWRDGGGELSKLLESDESVYKLRRFGNEFLIGIKR